MSTTDLIDPIAARLAAGEIVPYLGPGVLPADAQVPGNSVALAHWLSAKVAVPFKLKTNLTGAAQYIENFKHRKTLTKLMTEAFAPVPTPTPLHEFIAGLPCCPLVVHMWYDATLAHVFARRTDWSAVQGLSQAEHFGAWTGFYSAEGTSSPAEHIQTTLLYQPLGCAWPSQNFLVSDSDFVEVMTEIDIQTPIPQEVQQRRTAKSFLFLGCRFNDQMSRTFARQIMKRSSNEHWAVLPDELTRNERRFIEEQNIRPIVTSLDTFIAAQKDQKVKRAPTVGAQLTL